MENSFLRDAIDRITELARPSVMKVDDITYATARYYKVDGQQETPDPYEVDTLNALVKMIHTERTKAYKLLYVRVVSPTCVEVSSGYTRTRDCALDRATLYKAKSDVPRITFNAPMSQERAVIELQSLYAVTEDRDYLLALLSRIDVNQGVSSVDNGISQEVSVRTGAVLKE